MSDNNGEKESLSMPIKKGNIFFNPWNTWKDTEPSTLFKWIFLEKDLTNLPRDKKELDRTLPVHFLTENEINEFCKLNTENQIRVLWIGHSTCLVNMENSLILFDPVFSERCSPSQIVGPRRFRPVPMTIDKLPNLDAVVISHNHYDHLDHGSVKALNEKFGKREDNKLSWFVGLGTAAWFKSCGITENVHELNWWESRELNGIKYVFTPSQHWCGRLIKDRNKCLWGSWSLIGAKKKLFFAGDTGYCSAFEEIGKKFKGFDVSLIPIGAYHPRYMMEPQHVDPEQAVQVHLDIKSSKSIAIHWGTFALASEYYLEPPNKLREALEKFGQDINNFICLEHGKTLIMFEIRM